ncbi:unnamed protein product [Brachionus calyciflorus]|uniref:non-specific serine/threonine protein kinase n=1 Tax=Brachionus calyciflorus TaxID=104777 RepID=A0A813MB33_9BILA|nr:unnamed protein product [Brachionus calyciflorus]
MEPEIENLKNAHKNPSSLHNNNKDKNSTNTSKYLDKKERQAHSLIPTCFIKEFLNEKNNQPNLRSQHILNKPTSLEHNSTTTNTNTINKTTNNLRNKFQSDEQEENCVHSNIIAFATTTTNNSKKKLLNTTQTLAISKNIFQTNKTAFNNNINNNNNNKKNDNEFLNSYNLSKSLSTNSTPTKLTLSNSLKLSRFSYPYNFKLENKPKSYNNNSLSTWLHYPNLNYKTDNKCFTSFSADNSTEMTLSNPIDEIDNIRNVNNMCSRPNQNRVLEQAKIPNENLGTPNFVSVSSASSTTSSSSSPPTFSQNTQNSASTPSSLASSTASPQQKSAQATPTHPYLTHVDRFRIKKTLESELLNSTSTLTSTPTNPDLKAPKEELSDSLALNEISDTKLELPNESLTVQQQNINLERRISKFTVKKVDSSDLLLSKNKNENDIGIGTPDEKKKQDGLISNAQQQNIHLDVASSSIKEVIENLGMTQYQESLLLQSKQAEKLNNDQKNSDLLNTTRSNSIIEKGDLPETPKETDILEEEKPIDESPDKRFLKYDTEIGHGAFKTVFKGLDTESGVPVAWCELHDRKFNRTERMRFIEEAEMLKKLQHPNIVRFYEYWEDAKVKPKRIILVTELMTSGTLKAYVQRFRSTRLKVIKNFATQILKGLAYLHSRSPPVIHRDLKCDNIFVTGQSGQVKIGDLGLATLKKASFAKSVIGTPEFMAPEMYSEQYDESIDVYAFGMCLLEMATGEYPYQECSKPFEIYKRVTSGIKPENYNRIDNEDLKELIDLCIRLKRDERPSVKELLNHSWFMESNGLKLEILKDKNSQIIQKPDGTITFRLKVNDKTKRKPNWPQWPDNEEIEFSFDVSNDDPEEIVKELKDKTNKICDDDIKYLTQAIRDKIVVFRLEREDKSEDESNTIVNQTNANLNENVILQQSITNLENLTEKTQILNENQKILNESLAMVNVANEIQSINSQNQSQIFIQQQQNITLVQQNQIVNQQPQTQPLIQPQPQQQTKPLIPPQPQPQPQQPQQQSQPQIQPQPQQQQTPSIQNKQVQFIDQVKTNDEQIIKPVPKEIPIMLTVTDMDESGDFLNCILEIDNKEITFNLALGNDSTQSIIKEILNATKFSSDYENSLNEILEKIKYHINSDKQQNLISIKNQKLYSSLQSNKNKPNEPLEKKVTANEILVNQQSINLNNILALQQNINQPQVIPQTQQPPIQSQITNLTPLKPQSLVSVNYPNNQAPSQSQSQQISLVQPQPPQQQQQQPQPQPQPPIQPQQQANPYLDPSNALVQRQLNNQFEIINLLNTVENLNLQNSTKQLIQQAQLNQPKLIQINQNYVQPQPPQPPQQQQQQQQIQNPIKHTNQNEYLDLILKNQNPNYQQSLLHNALMTHFINNHQLMANKQANNSILQRAGMVNNVSPLNLQALQANLAPNLSAQILPSPSNNSIVANNSQIHQSEIEPKPTYASVLTTNSNNLIPMGDNSVVQNVQNQILNQQINQIRPFQHLNESLIDQDLSLNNLDDSKLITSIQNVLNNQKIEQSQGNDILEQLGERVKFALKEKIIEQTQVNDYNLGFNNQTMPNPIHHNPHQQHLNENIGTYSPTLSRRNSIDLKDKKAITSIKTIEPNKAVQNFSNTQMDQIDSSTTPSVQTTTTEPVNNQQFNENALNQLIMNIVHSNQFNQAIQQHAVTQQQIPLQPQQQQQQIQYQLNPTQVSTAQQTNQLISNSQQQQQQTQLVLNQAQQVQNQISSQQLQQAILNQPQKQIQQQQQQQQQQLNNLNENMNMIENQNRNFGSLPTSFLLNMGNRSNLEELFLRQRREFEDLLRKQQLELQEYVLESLRKSLNNS